MPTNRAKKQTIAMLIPQYSTDSRCSQAKNDRKVKKNSKLLGEVGHSLNNLIFLFVSRIRVVKLADVARVGGGGKMRPAPLL